jgi:hypothetical protein
MRKMRNKRGRRGKKAQITIWIIIAIVIVAVIALIFYLTPLKNLVISSKPSIQIQDCVGSSLKKAIQEVSKTGGSINPVNYISYKGEKIEYLCYTNEYYKTCSNQQPLLKQHVEREILDNIKGTAQRCINNLKQDLESRGYSVASKGEDISVSIGQNNVKVIFSGLDVSKGSTGESYKSFVAEEKSKIYDLIMLTSSILNWEARYGDADITSYMLYYPNIKVEKYKQSDGSKIYILTETNTKDKFVFATRSLSWPAGYSFGQTYKPVA